MIILDPPPAPPPAEVNDLQKKGRRRIQDEGSCGEPLQETHCIIIVIIININIIINIINIIILQYIITVVVMCNHLTVIVMDRITTTTTTTIIIIIRRRRMKIIVGHRLSLCTNINKI